MVYGRLYKFNPSKQGLLYLPMLIGSLLAECGTGRAGDKCVAADLSGTLGLLIGRRNAEYAASKKANDVESPTSATGIHQSKGDIRSDSTKVPEMRLVLALVGVLVCIVSVAYELVSPARYLLTQSLRQVFCGLALGSKSTFIGQTSPWRAASRRTVPRW